MLIISSSKDVSTNKVIERFLAQKASAIRINSEDKISEEAILQLLGNVFWLRRGNFPRSLNRLSQDTLVPEYQRLSRFFHHLAEENKNSLGSLVKGYDHNKLIDLEKAKQAGLPVPETHIVNRKQSLVQFITKGKAWITKSIKDPNEFIVNGKNFSGGFTSLLTGDILNQLPETFFPSLIQEKIEKSLEVRIFYLKGLFYPMAIFSQADEQTKIDFRHYNYKKPNRYVPFKLPDEIKGKINLLMKKLELNTGSLDFIMDKKGEFVFLECNPVGQFDWVSENCNYQIERKIAKVLMNEVA